MWIGGILYEHTHRLMATVVGMLSIVLTIAAWRIETRRWVRWLSPAYSYLASNDPRAHFGLGDADRVDAITVLWPDGLEEEFPGPACDQCVRLKRGQGSKRFGGGEGYLYAHDYPEGYVPQAYLPEGRVYYVPSDHGTERRIKERLDHWRSLFDRKGGVPR